MLLSITTFAQVKVSTLSGKADNTNYTNGIGSNSTYLFPLGVAVDSQGNVFAFDDYVNVIRKIQPDGFTSQFCGNGNFVSPSFVSGFADGNSTTALFYNITAIAIDKQDNLYVIDNNRLRKITPQGFVTTITTDQTAFKSPEGICIDASGTIYVSDTGNKRIRKVATTGTITTIASGFVEPKGICLDAQGNLIVADATAIKKVTPTGTITTIATGFSAINGIVVDLDGNINVADSYEHKIKKVDANGLVSVLSGNSQGFQDTSTLFFWRLPKFYNPKGLAIDSNGNLIVADTWNNRIRKISK